MTNLSDNFIEEIKDHELVPPLHNSSVLVQTSRWTQADFFEQYYDDTTPYPLFLNMKEGEGVGYISLTKHKNLAREVLQRYWNDPGVLADIKSKYSSMREEFHILYPEILVSDGYGVEVSDADKVEKARQLAWSINALVFFSIYLDQELCREVLSGMGEDELVERLPSVWEDISEPFGESFERRRTTRVVEMLEANSSWREIANHLGYFVCSYIDVPSLSEIQERMMDEYGEFGEAKRRESFLRESKAVIQSKQDKWRKLTADLTDKERKIASYIQDLIILRDKRKDELAMITVLLTNFARSRLKEAGIDQSYAPFVLYDELVNGKRHLRDIEQDIKQRPEGVSVYVPYEGDVKHELGKFTQNREKIESYFLDNEAVDKLNGQAGSTGSAQGTAKIIQNLSVEAGNFNLGDILVTGMTRPEFVPLMKKAAAIVTDEGGVTCHAAVVSRELEIPCVIGTQNATRVLEDGDEIEVDADEGVVTILNQ